MGHRSTQGSLHPIPQWDTTTPRLGYPSPPHSHRDPIQTQHPFLPPPIDTRCPLQPNPIGVPLLGPIDPPTLLLIGHHNETQ